MKQLVAVMAVASLGAVAACGKQAAPSECDKAVANLVVQINAEWKKLGEAEVTGEGERAQIERNIDVTKKACVADKWSAPATRCLQQGKNLDEMTKCWEILTEEQRNHYYEAVGLSPGDSKPVTAKYDVEKLVNEAYAMWSQAHPDKECPGGLDDLLEYVAMNEGKDPWGNRYRVMCGETLPAALKGQPGIKATSDGPDGKEGTADDVRSW